ncbi:MAG TPA: prolyl oligopeptidase family serine peptidase [Candidatus Saccharimonadales bacterium]|nr:prolyl oligopeptidase family serine peptidase [Candidatus Saccharimonadales bacterium]
MAERSLPPMTPADIARQVVVEELDLSADGRLAVVVRRSIRRGRYVSHLYGVPIDGLRVGRPRRLTDGPVRDTRPRLSSDGRTVAFVRSDPYDDDAPGQLATTSIDGGRVRLRPPRRHGAIGDLAWSPDGRRLAFTAEVDPPRFLVGKVPPVDRRPARDDADEAPLGRHIRRVDWRWDGEGHRDRWSHLFVVERGGLGRPRQVTRGDWGVEHISWHPDGRTIAFTADRGESPDLHPRPTIWAVDIGGGSTEPPDPREVLAPAGWAMHPAYSPDGRWLAAIGVLAAEPLDDVSPGILLGAADGAGPPRALAPDLDRPIGNWADSDLTGWMVDGRHGPLWRGVDEIVATVSDRGRSLPASFRLDATTGRPAKVPVPLPRDQPTPWAESVVQSIAVPAPGTVGPIVALATDGTDGLEVVTLDEREPGPKPRWGGRTSFGTAWQRRFAPILMRRVDAPGPSGPIETWIASPSGAGTAPLPTVVDVHGGPLGAWAPTPHVEVLLLASAGYRVVLPNIRGSATYGRDWIRPQLGDWGGVDAADVHAALDHVIGLGLADPERLGILGLSYGGFMVHWLVGTTDRFRAAVSENGVTNQVSDWANSDSGPEYDRASLLGDPFSPAGVEKLWRQSPLRNVAAVRTPLLMLQAEADLRCPPQDNEQFFVALRHLGRTVEYVLYPEESHVYGSSGRPDRRIDRNERILDWFGRYLR